MKAETLAQERHVLAENAFAEIVILARAEGREGFVPRTEVALGAGTCVLRHDNEAGKGDHRHLGGVGCPYSFRDVETLLSDFWTDVDAWRHGR